MIRAASAGEAEQPPGQKLLRKVRNTVTFSPYIVAMTLGKQQPEKQARTVAMLCRI
jgi:hypothetical protein